MSEELKFPDGFLWGAATSAYQVEGGIENNNWAEAGRAGRVPAAGPATDQYNRYAADFDIARELGHNAHRFSIEWARVEPEEGRFDESAIEHYRDVLRALRARRLEPFVTLWHFTLPIWFARKGGFQSRQAPETFVRYCAYVIERLGDMAKFWITINEPMVYVTGGYLPKSKKSSFNWPPFKKNLFTYIKVINILTMSHNLVYNRIKADKPDLQIGITKNNQDWESNKNPAYRLASMFMKWFWNRRFLDKIAERQDFIGVNHYFHRKLGEKKRHPTNDLGWEIYPKGIYNVLAELKSYAKPIYITENGLADEADSKRARFIKDYLYWLHRAIQAGVVIRGYFHWSLIDNFEWAYGFGPRFGLVEVDYNTLERKIRPSAWEYAKICRSNKLTAD